MYLLIDSSTQEPELKQNLTRTDQDDADMGLVTIIDLIGTPKKDILRYIKGGSWEVVAGREE